MEYLLLTILTFVLAFVEPFLVGTVGVSIFFVLSICTLKRSRRILLFTSVVIFSLVLDTVFGYSLGVYLVAVVTGFLANLLLGLAWADDRALQGFLKNFFSSVVFYLVLNFASVLKFSVFTPSVLLTVFFASIFTSILIIALESILGSSLEKRGSFLKFRK